MIKKEDIILIVDVRNMQWIDCQKLQKMFFDYNIPWCGSKFNVVGIDHYIWVIKKGKIHNHMMKGYDVEYVLESRHDDYDILDTVNGYDIVESGIKVYIEGSKMGLL